MIGFMDLCGTMWYHVTMWDPCSLAKLVSFTELTRVSGSQTSRFFIEVWTNKSFTGGATLYEKNPLSANRHSWRKKMLSRIFRGPHVYLSRLMLEAWRPLWTISTWTFSSTGKHRIPPPRSHELGHLCTRTWEASGHAKAQRETSGETGWFVL
jgi:hypothetical protein